MINLELFSMHNLALISDWLQETGELYVEFYHSFTKDTSIRYFINSMNDLKSVVVKHSWNEFEITILRRKQYPLRGIADENFLERTLQQIHNGKYYTLVLMSLSKFPSCLTFHGEGKSHEELRRDFAKLSGEEIAIGLGPYDIYDVDWFFEELDEVLRMTVLRGDKTIIGKNQDYYEPYAKEPERYQWLAELWRE
jgi:hypothetical protein